ncbi:MAG: polyketide cyclase [Thiobacillus sp. SCN 63-374]|nr:MAG: polyketide cyclase [Thiobacillus sp. SCN 63-374]
MITKAQADRVGKEWIEAWNSHDLDRILSHYSEDVVMSSPHIAVIAGEPSGVLKGKRAVGDYWRQALSRIPDLHFELLATFAGADSVAIHYNGVSGPVIEVLFFDAGGLVERATAHYLP